MDTRSLELLKTLLKIKPEYCVNSTCTWKKNNYIIRTEAMGENKVFIIISNNDDIIVFVSTLELSNLDYTEYCYKIEQFSEELISKIFDNLLIGIKKDPMDSLLDEEE